MISTLITIAVILVVAAIIVGLIDRVIPGDPVLLYWAKVVVIVGAALWICFLLLGLAGIHLG